VFANEDLRTESTQIGAAMRCVIRTAKEWEAVREYGRVEDATIHPGDFEGSMFLLASMGYRPTLRYHIRIDSVSEAGDGAEAFVSQSYPELAEDQPTYPVDIVRVPRRLGTIRFVER